LISVILSAQATDVSVNKVTPELFSAFPTPEEMFEAGSEKIFAHIRSIGLAPTKSKNIAATCGQLVKLHKGEVPDKREDLEALPGVGRKTANVILNTAFGVPVIAVDTHIFRLSNRTGLAPGETVIKVEQKLMSVVPAKWKKDAHHLLILHGRYVCRARKPDCGHCVISQECELPDKIVT
jgi:endonuclease-3